MSYRQQIRCTARRSSDGQPCQRWAMLGQTTCATHGGRAPRAKAKGARVEAERKAMQRLSREGVVPVDDPLTAFAALAGECVRLKDYLGDRVAVLEELRYRGVGGEMIRGELQAYGAALDRTIRVLAEYGRLNIDERLAQVSETQVHLLAGALALALERVGLAGEGRDTVRRLVSVLLRSAADSSAPREVPAELLPALERLRSQVTLPDRTAVLQDELGTVRAELVAVQAQRDDLLDALRRHASGPPLAIEPAPVAVSVADVVAGNVPDDVEEVEAVVVEEPRAGHPLAFSASVYVGDGYDD